MLDANALIEKHRAKGVLVDANLLVLFLVGTVNRRRILDFKRTQAYSVEDFYILVKLIDWFGKLIATPHVLSQASDLAALPGRELYLVRQLFKLVVETTEENYEPSRVLVVDPLFGRLGLTDSAIASVCCSGVLVLTSDIELQLALQHRGADALNFDHVRQIKWKLHPH